MPTLREIDTTFRKLIADQQKLVERLKDEKHHNATQRHEYKAAWRGAIEDFVRHELAKPSMSVLRRMTRASKKLDNPIDFKQALQDFIEDSRNARQRKVEMIARHGSRETIEQEYEDTRAVLTERLSERDALHTHISDREDEYAEIRAFNKEQTEAGLKRLLPKNKDFFTVKQVRARMKNFIQSPSYRKGKKLLKDYEDRTGKDFFNEYEDIQQLKEDLYALNREVGDLESITDGQSALLRRMDDVDSRIKTEAQIGEEVRELVTELMEDRDFFDAMVAEYGENFPRKAVEQRAKADTLKQVGSALARRIDRHEDTINQLSKAINSHKFRKGLRRKPHHRVGEHKVDLDKITKQVNAQQALGALHIGGIHNLRNAVAEFDRSTTTNRLRHDDGGLASTTNLLLLYVLMSDNTDNFITSQNVDVPKDVAAAAGVDLDALSPDLSGLEKLDDLGISASDIGLDAATIGNIDIDDLGKLDVGNIDSGGDLGSGIDTGSISIDVPTIDPGGLGGGGGFDGGGF